jgi:molybdenum ABC transporter molybdate-binding protein
MTLPTALYNAGLVEKPVAFTTNKLVLVVRKSNPAGIKSVFDLKKSGIKLIVGTPTVPIGSYTRTILKNLALTSVLSNAVSLETDVRQILAKVALGEADAGFVYITDAKTVTDQVIVITLPPWAQPPVRYGVAVIKSTKARSDAVAFVNKVLSKAGQAKLRAAGFGAVQNGVTSYARRLTVRKALFPLGMFVAAAVTGAFLLPSDRDLHAASCSRPCSTNSGRVVTDARVVSIKTTVIAQVLIILFGTPTAYLIATRRFRGRALAITLVELLARAAPGRGGDRPRALGGSGCSGRRSVPSG